jgi:hypothetical protein
MEERAAVKKHPLIEDALEILRRHDIAAEIENGGAHVKLRFTNSFGCPCLLIIAGTPGCRRALQQSRATLRRLLRRRPAQ